MNTARENYSDYCEETGIHLAEEDVYQYLKDCFFQIPGAAICIWEENGSYISALRLEPYLDGVLIAGLETLPKFRGKGYATRLMSEVLAVHSGNIYSHVDKKNIPSLRVHEKCGFTRIKESARFLDGSVDFRTCTFHINK